MADGRTAPPGYTLRAPREDDIPKVADLIVRYDTEVGGYSDFSEEHLREMDRHPRFDTTRDSWLIATR